MGAKGKWRGVCQRLAQADQDAIAWYKSLPRGRAATSASFLDALEALYREKDKAKNKKDGILITAKIRCVELHRLAHSFKNTRHISRVADRAFRLQLYGIIHAFRWTNRGMYTDHIHSLEDFLYCRLMSCYEFVHWCGWLASSQPTSHSVPSVPLSHGSARHVIDKRGGKISDKNAKLVRYHIKDGLTETRYGQTFTYCPKASKILLGTVPGQNNDGGYYHVGISDGMTHMYHLNFGKAKCQRIGEVFSAQRYWGNVYEADYNYPP